MNRVKDAFNHVGPYFSGIKEQTSWIWHGLWAVIYMAREYLDPLWWLKSKTYAVIWQYPIFLIVLSAMGLFLMKHIFDTVRRLVSERLHKWA